MHDNNTTIGIQQNLMNKYSEICATHTTRKH